MEVLFTPSTVPRMWSRSWKWRWVESKILQLCIVSKMWWIHKIWRIEVLSAAIEQVVSAYKLEWLYATFSDIDKQFGFKDPSNRIFVVWTHVPLSCFRWIQLGQSPFYDGVFIGAFSKYCVLIQFKMSKLKNPSGECNNARLPPAQKCEISINHDPSQNNKLFSS